LRPAGRPRALTLLILASLPVTATAGAGWAAVPDSGIAERDTVAACPFPENPPRPETWAQRVPSATLKNWYKVDADVYRSEQPTREGFKEIRAKGIKSVINLRFEHTDAALVKGLDLVLIEVRMTAWDFSEDDVVRALKAIESAPKPVLVHCQHGSDRTGLIVAMYRVVYLNWPKEEALAEMKRGGFGFHWYYVNIPAFIKQADVAAIRKRLGLGLGPTPHLSCSRTNSSTFSTSSLLPMKSGVRWWRDSGWMSRMRRRPSDAPPPACSATKASGAAS
jgi:protein tyrosine phosphatase (PTP) superfamily phosphohydrolase (DUF442 family)